MGKHELLTKGEEVFLLTENGETVGIREAVGTLALSTYANLIDMSKEEDCEEKKRLEDKITFQSKVLDSLSRACQAIRF